jgi:hypothetical protein
LIDQSIYFPRTIFCLNLAFFLSCLFCFNNMPLPANRHSVQCSFMFHPKTDDPEREKHRQCRRTIVTTDSDKPHFCVYHRKDGIPTMPRFPGDSDLPPPAPGKDGKDPSNPGNDKKDTSGGSNTGATAGGKSSGGSNGNEVMATEGTSMANVGSSGTQVWSGMMIFPKSWVPILFRYI